MKPKKLHSPVKRPKNKKKSPLPLPYAPAESARNNAGLDNSKRYDDVYYELHPGVIEDVVPMGSQSFAVVTDADIQLKIEVWSDRCLRFHYALDGFDREFSYARDPEARQQASTVKLKESKTGWRIETPALRCEIARKDGKIKATDLATKTVIHEYAAPFYVRTTLMKGLEQLRLQLTANKKEGFFGLGDKSWDTDLHGRYFRNWNEDAFAYGKERDTLYRSVPFYLGLLEATGYGLFLDNTYRTHFDFNSRTDGLTTIWAEGGEFSYYLFTGPSLDQVAADYALLTGTTELPPLWAIGYHQCRWSYYPEKRVREIASSFREKRIPCDSIYLDIDYMDGYRCFTWNHDHFPDPKKMIADLKEDGFHTVVMIDPGIKVDEDYHVYTEGTEEDVWCMRPDGRPMVGPVWPPECVWPDFTDPDVREWWGPLYQELYLEQGVSGFWNDMNEPAVFRVNRLTFPDSVVHDLDGRGGDHAEAHNIYGMQMSRASWDGLKELQPSKRPFLLCRATFSGGQRYAALWTGDNIANWEHLAMANRQCVRLSISGFSFVGTDIGGFVDEPGGELLVRWLQLAVFHPLMRIHSMGNNTDGAAEADADEVAKQEKDNRQDQEPWAYGNPHTDRARTAIEMRYRLLPYLYTAMQQHRATGTPVLRNLFFYDQSDKNCRKYGDQFLCGQDLLVAPIVKEGAKQVTVYLPKGNWVDYQSSKVYEGGRKYKLSTDPNYIPVFVRSGAILPIAPVTQHTGELTKVKEMQLNVYASEKTGYGEWYWDAGEGYDYEKNGFRKASFGYTNTKNGFALIQATEGDYQSSVKNLRVRIYGLISKASKAMVDDKKVKLSQTKTHLELVVPVDFSEVVLLS
ncbi:hypothetical protein CEQ90_05930 [Lewinellaceae bacterium SD302]|nr:hypothetical protein CEQ90_05930 [Lewinellaceae bacterium SD302]